MSRWPLLVATLLVAGAAACILPYERLEGGCKGTCDDAAAPDGGSVEGDAAVDGANLSFCGLFTGVFCDDFDGKPLDQVWSMSAPAGGGTIGLDSTMPKSAPHALETIAATTGQTAFVTKNVAGATGKVHHIGFSLLIAEQGETAGLFSLKPAGPTKPLFRWSVGGGGPAHSYIEENNVVDSGQAPSHSDPRTPTKNVWVRVGVDVDFGNRTFVMRWDGVEIISFTFDSAFELDTPQLLLGIGYLPPSNTSRWRVLYDDVLYRVE